MFDEDGKFLSMFGTNGSGDGEFNYPTGIAFTRDEKLVVADRDNYRVQVFRIFYRHSLQKCIYVYIFLILISENIYLIAS